MPASTLDPVNAALRASLSKNNSENVLETQIAGSTKKALLANIEFESAGSYHSSVLESLKSKYIVLRGGNNNNNNNNDIANKASKPEGETGMEETLKLPQYELYPMESVQLGWSEYGEWSAGSGMINMGNTCYLNSTLQALFHVPALVNWLISDKEHSSGCFESGGTCIICSMRKTLVESQNSNMNAIRPLYIYNKLRFICRNFILGRQEDAHEFLRHLVEAMERAYLSRLKNHDQLDPRVKETTPLNQIFGGYLRSAVHCLECGHVSTTFQHFQDLLLDIRKAQTLEEALDGYFSREKLDDESYQCESCRKKVAATKQFSIERAPMVLCVQLKRFSVSNTKITKHITFRQRLDLTKFARCRPTTPLVYKLVSLVTHMGPTVNCGHYTAVALAPSGNFYQFDDSAVRPISYQGVFSTNAYILMYELESPPFPHRNTPQKHIENSNSLEQTCSSTNNNNKQSKNQLNGFTSDKVYGPNLPPRLLKTNGNSMTNGINNNHTSDESDTENNDEKPSQKSNGNDKRIIPFTPPFAEKIVNYPKENSEKITKLVPYEADDSSNSEDSTKNECVDTVNGKWKVTSNNKDDTTSEKCWKNNDKTVNELFKMSHSGYSAPVSTWNGNRARLDKEVANERREDRKRTYAEMNENDDQGRTKHVKNHNNNFKSNPGYNPIEEYHSAKNWNRNNGRYYNNKQFYNGKNRHRRNFHHKNYNNKKFSFRQ